MIVIALLIFACALQVAFLIFMAIVQYWINRHKKPEGEKKTNN